ncbi:MAG: hypothetical protein Q8N51_16965 [Gammaproteobacteria bacterium]|nr:hypothetical protein [Gammaproteobacteria bacterium]
MTQVDENYRYGFEFSESNGRKVIRYRQDKLWFKAGCAWYVFFTLISLMFLLGERWAWQLPIPAFGFLVWRRSRKREISVGETDLRVGKKAYDRAKISRLFVENNGVRQGFRYSAQDYNEVARRVERDPLGGDAAMARASAMAADATTSVAMMVAGGIDSKGKKVQMEYDGKNVVIARWLSVQRAMILANAVGGLLGYTMDEEGGAAAKDG